MRSAARRRPRSLRHAVAPCILLAQAAVAAPDFPAGQYRISSQTVMPHLDQMRRIVNVESRCLAGAPEALFPVMRQPALTGCRLVAVPERAPGRYSLACRSDRVATGSAEIAIGAHAVHGDLRIKMGGKNMTFSQHVEARRRGACGDR